MDQDFTLWQILVPTVSNEGKPFRTRFHRVWDKKVRDIAGGLTICQPVTGQWVDGDALYKERMIPVQIACSKQQIEDIMAFTKVYYEQLKVFCYKLSETVLIK